MFSASLPIRLTKNKEMREIKFRAWDEKGKQMIEHENLQMNCDGFCVIDEEATMFPMDIIMQFTGLKDKNGKEIYEGDFLGTYEGEELGWENHGKVIWWNESAKFFLADKDNYMSESELSEETQEWNDTEIIGNIYENPNLLL